MHRTERGKIPESPYQKLIKNFTRSFQDYTSLNLIAPLMRVFSKVLY